MRKNIYFKTLFSFFATIAISFSLKAQTIDLSQPLPIDSTVVKGQLPNGLTYYIKPNSKPAQKVELRLVVKAGSILENDDQRGFAHFMEHMNFNGLKHFPKNELVDYLQKIGVQFGADLNANTGWDRTYFILPIPTDKTENLENGFQIVADWAGNALITTDEVNDERHVILEESRMRTKNAGMRMVDKFLPSYVNGSHYAERLPIGLDSLILNGSPDKIREFYHDWYRPDLEALIVVGDVTVPQAEELIKKYFSYLKNPANERPRTIYEIPPYAEKKAMIVSDSEATDYDFNLLYPTHKLKVEKTLGDFKNGLIRSLMVQSVNRKLRDLTQTANPPFTSANINIGTGFSLGNENFSLELNPVDNFQTSINAAIGELLRVEKFGLSDADIQTSKNEILASYESSYNERNTTESGNYTEEYAANFMQGDPIPGIANAYTYIKELLPTISAQDVNNEATKWISDNQNYFALITGPQKGKIQLPTQDELLTIVNNAFQQEVTKGAEKTHATSLLSAEPTPGTIVSETKDTSLGITTYTLSNGIKVTVKPTDFKKDEILLSGEKYGGTNLYSAKDKSNTTFLTSVISSMGYGQFTPTALSDFLAGKNVNVGVKMGNISNSVSGSSSVKDLETLLQLAYLKLTSPRIDTSLYQGFTTKFKSQLQFLKANPEYAFQDSLNKVLYNNNPLMPIVLPTSQDIDNINMDRAVEIYKEQFGNASGFHFFFVGNVNEDTLKPLLEKYIASLPTSGTPVYKDNGLRSITGTKVFKFYKGADQKSTIINIYHGNIKYSEDADLKADMLAQAMTIQIIDTIREKMQAIYNGDAFGSLVELPYNHYSIGAELPCGPENVDKILAEYHREINAYKKTGVSDVNLEKVKKSMLEKHKEALKQNGYWADKLEDILFWKHSKQRFLNYNNIVNKVTSSDLKVTANQLFGDNEFTAVSYPDQTSAPKK